VLISRLARRYAEERRAVGHQDGVVVVVRPLEVVDARRRRNAGDEFHWRIGERVERLAGDEPRIARRDGRAELRSACGVASGENRRIQHRRGTALEIDDAVIVESVEYVTFDVQLGAVER